MHFSPDGKFVRTDVWREGEYLDLWSVVHFLTGISTAAGLSFFSFGFWPSTIIAALAFAAYEMWEALMKIEETRWNRFFDVVVGLVSFVPTLLFFVPTIPDGYYFQIFGTVLAVNLALSRVGWHASKKAEVLEAKLRAEIEMQKERIKVGTARFEQKFKEKRLRWKDRRRKMFKRAGLRSSLGLSDPRTE